MSELSYDQLRTLASIRWHASGGLNALKSLDPEGAIAIAKIELTTILNILSKVKELDIPEPPRNVGNLVVTDRRFWSRNNQNNEG